MSEPAPETVRIGSQGDVVCTAARMLGFMPSDSLVVMTTRGPRRGVGMVLRFDLELAAEPEDLAAEIEDRLHAQAADGAFVIVYDDSIHGSDRDVHCALVVELMSQLSAQVFDIILVSRGRWWSLICDDPHCCPPEGTFVDGWSPGATAVAAAYAFAGHGLLPDREAVVASIAYRGDRVTEAVMTTLVGKARTFFRYQSREVRVRTVLHELRELAGLLADPRNDPPQDTVADLIALCDDVLIRDEVLIEALDPAQRAMLVGVLRRVVRLVPPPIDAPLCASLAWIAYALGDGVLANVALARALDSDPDYSLGLLIESALVHQLPPEHLEWVMRDAALILHPDLAEE